MAKLSDFVGTVPDYIEFGWVTAPNAAGQSIPANTIETLNLDTEVADTGNLVNAPTANTAPQTGHTFTLPAGTYYYEASTSGQTFGVASATLALYNVSDSAYISRGRLQNTDSRHTAGLKVDRITGTINGQFVISASKDFDLRLLSNVAFTVDNGTAGTGLSTDSTADADQRTTIKLWKLK